MTPDGLPLHGPVPGVERLVLACGHGPQGITWGAGAGEAVAEGIATGDLGRGAAARALHGAPRTPCSLPAWLRRR